MTSVCNFLQNSENIIGGGGYPFLSEDVGPRASKLASGPDEIVQQRVVNLCKSRCGFAVWSVAKEELYASGRLDMIVAS